jgi:hypothetical protein
VAQQGALKGSDQVTLLVFKDNLTARTLLVPLRWILRLGLAVGFCILVASTASFLAIRFYRVARTADPSRFQEIEKELDDIRASYRSLEAKVGGGALPAVTPSALESAPAPAVTSAPVTSPSNIASMGFLSWVTGKPMAAPPDAATIPVRVNQPRAIWRGKTLRVQFTLQYVKTDGGGLQGRVVVLARGPQALMAYPDGVMNSESGTLLDTKRGEYFSVKRLREVRADFGPFTNRKDINEVQILLFDLNGAQLLYAYKVAPEVGKAAHVESEAPDAAAPADGAPAGQAPAVPGAAPAPSTPATPEQQE